MPDSWLPVSRLLAIVFACWLLVGVPLVSLAAVDLPDVTAEGVYAFDPETGEVIIDANGDEPLKIGSVTKVVTALVVIDHLDLDDEIEVDSSDMIPPGYSAMSLQPGDTLTVEQLLIGLLVVSGGDAAMTLARTVGSELSGSDDPDEAVAAFVDAMNEKAIELGAEDSAFANPDGADSDEAYATAHDVALLYAALEDHPELAAMAAMTEYSFESVGPEATPYTGVTTNQLAGTNGVISAKTGSEVGAGGCIVLAQQTPDRPKVIIVILGSSLTYDEETWTPIEDARWDDAQAVIGAIETNWEPQVAEIEPTATTAPVVAEATEAPAPTQPPSNAGEAPQPVVEEPGPPLGSEASPLLAVIAGAGIIGFAVGSCWMRVPVLRDW